MAKTNTSAIELEKETKEIFNTAEKELTEKGKIEPEMTIEFKDKKGTAKQLSVVIGGEMFEKRFSFLDALGSGFGLLHTTKFIGEVEKITFVSEVWFSTLKKGEKMVSMPSKDINKKEALLVSSMNNKGENKLFSKEIHTISIDSNGKKKFILSPINNYGDGIGDNNLLKCFFDSYHKSKVISKKLTVNEGMLEVPLDRVLNVLMKATIKKIKIN